MAGQITITVEDGTNVAGANSYVTQADARTFNLNRGLPFPVKGVTGDPDNDDAAAMVLLRAMDKLERFAFIGCLQFPPDATAVPPVVGQPLSWPRAYALGGEVVGWNDGYGFDTSGPIQTGIPKAVLTAQMRLASIISTGVDLYPIITGFAVIREQVGPLVTQYDPRYGTQDQPYMTEIDDILAGLLDGSTSQVVRAFRA